MWLGATSVFSCTVQIGGNIVTWHLLKQNFLKFAIRLFVKVCACADCMCVNAPTGATWDWCGESPRLGPGRSWSWQELLLNVKLERTLFNYSEPLSALLGCWEALFANSCLTWVYHWTGLSAHLSPVKLLLAISDSKYLCITPPWPINVKACVVSNE